MALMEFWMESYLFPGHKRRRGAGLERSTLDCRQDAGKKGLDT